MGRRRKSDWSPYAVPGIRDNLARGLVESIARARDMIAVAHRLDVDPGPHIEGILRRERLTVDTLDAASLFWVSSDMADIALDASQDIPEVAEDAPPSEAGLMLFESPLPSIHELLPDGLPMRDPQTFETMKELYRGPVPLDGVLWRRADSRMEVELLTRTGRLPAPLVWARTTLTPVKDVFLPLPLRFDDTPTSFRGAVGVLAFLAAAWHLMSTPSVAKAVDVEPRTGARRSVEVTAPVEPSLVRVIEARPMRTVRAGGGESSGRTYTHRWVVRGHWRDQPYGKDRKLRRTQWVESYLKGPEGAPIKRHEIVRAWRR